MTFPSGISFPFRFGPSGGVATDDGGDKVMSNLSALARTTVGQRLIRKAVGSIGTKRLFRSGISNAAKVTENLILDAIARLEPRAVGTTAKVYEKETDSGNHMFVDVAFAFKNTVEPIAESIRLT